MKSISLLILSLAIASCQIDPGIYEETTDAIIHKEDILAQVSKCPNGFVYANNSKLLANDCFFISNYEKTWKEASDECSEKNSTLLIIPTKIIIDYTTQILSAFRLDTNYLVKISFYFMVLLAYL